MASGFTQLPKPTIIAHRGSSAHAPENTLAAFEIAIKQHADAVELDAKLSADGQVVVIHDQTIDRTTATHGFVHSFSLLELKKLDAGNFFDPAFKNERIPTLAEVFDLLKGKMFINVELTNYLHPNDALPEKIAALVNKHDIAGQLLFSSFNPRALVRVRRCLPDVPIALLADSGWRGAIARSSLGSRLRYQALNPYFKDVNRSLVNYVHKRQCRMYVYTVNQPEEMMRLKNLGVDGIFTDDPLLARTTLFGN